MMTINAIQLLSVNHRSPTLHDCDGFRGDWKSAIRGCEMVQRYILVEQSIAAAGAAFACMDEDYSDVASARQAARRAQAFWIIDEAISFMAASFARLMKQVSLEHGDIRRKHSDGADFVRF